MRGTRHVICAFVLASAIAVPSARADSGQMRGDDWAPAERQFIVLCEFSHRSKDDPILHFGENDAAHMHDFFGNRYTDEDSTPESLEEAEAEGTDPYPTTCDDSEQDLANQSAYWTPALYAPNEPKLGSTHYLEPLRTRNYYRDGGIEDLNSIVPFPDDFSMISGNAGASDLPQSIRVIQWSCIKESPGEGEFETIQEALDDANGTVGASSCPDDVNNYNGHLRLRVLFPNCWDRDGSWPWAGDHGQPDSTRVHMRYSWENNRGNPQSDPIEEARSACPTNFPIVLPELQTGVRWDVADYDLTGAYLSSDASGEHDHGQLDNGGTAHADFMNGWDQEALDQLVYCQIRRDSPLCLN